MLTMGRKKHSCHKDSLTEVKQTPGALTTLWGPPLRSTSH